MTSDEQAMEDRKRYDEKMWRGIYRKMGDSIQGWRSCSVKACRRRRQCSSDSFACIEKRRREDTRVFTPEEQAQSLHELRLMLDARLAQVRGQTRVDEEADAAMPWRKR